MPFIEADYAKEETMLNKLIEENEEIRKAHEEHKARWDLQMQLIQARQTEQMSQADLAHSTGLSQQAISRIEKGTGLTVKSLLRYLSGLGYTIQLKKL